MKAPKNTFVDDMSPMFADDGLGLADALDFLAFAMTDGTFRAIARLPIHDIFHKANRIVELYPEKYVAWRAAMKLGLIS